MAEIDFTEDRIFGEMRRKLVFPSRTSFMNADDFPWNREIKEDAWDMEDPVELLFPTGTTGEIAEKHSIRNLCFGAVCVRCGAPLIQFPWQMQRELCDRCSDEMDRQYSDPLPWESSDSQPEEDAWWLDL